MEKPLLALHSPLALPSSHWWSRFLLSWVRAAMWGALLGVECRSRRLALSEEQRPTVTSGRWLVFPVLVFPSGDSLEGRTLKEPAGQPL